MSDIILSKKELAAMVSKWRQTARELQEQFKLLDDPEAKIRAMALSVSYENCAAELEAHISEA